MQSARTYGDFTESVPIVIEGLTIVFSPTSVSLKERWKNNSLSADFMADYFATFYALHGSDEEGRLAYVKGAVSFVANELIENAMKFTDVEGIPISIRLTMHQGELVFFASNGASIAGSQNYEAAVKRLLNADPWAAYERRAHFGVRAERFLKIVTDSCTKAIAPRKRSDLGMPIGADVAHATHADGAVSQRAAECAGPARALSAAGRGGRGG